MKNLLNFKSLFTLLGVIALTMISCRDDNRDKLPLQTVKVEDVVGSYSGDVITAQGTARKTVKIDFAATNNAIKFDDLPVSEVVNLAVKDPKKAEEALKKIGKVPYELSYTAKLNSNQKEVQLTLSPKNLEFNLPVDGTVKKVSVQFSAKQLGSYTATSRAKILKYAFMAEKISVDGTQVSPGTGISYIFPMSVKK